VNLHRGAPLADPALDPDGADSALVLRGWTGEYLQVREIDEGDVRLWHPDGSYFGRLVPTARRRHDPASGTVFGPSGLYLADAVNGRLRIDPARRRARVSTPELDEAAFASPGDLEPVERRWPRRG
jgi:hypothetical protein